MKKNHRERGGAKPSCENKNLVELQWKKWAELRTFSFQQFPECERTCPNLAACIRAFLLTAPAAEDVTVTYRLVS